MFFNIQKTLGKIMFMGGVFLAFYMHGTNAEKVSNMTPKQIVEGLGNAGKWFLGRLAGYYSDSSTFNCLHDDFFGCLYKMVTGGFEAKSTYHPDKVLKDAAGLW